MLCYNRLDRREMSTLFSGFWAGIFILQVLRCRASDRK